MKPGAMNVRAYLTFSMQVTVVNETSTGLVHPVWWAGYMVFWTYDSGEHELKFSFIQGYFFTHTICWRACEDLQFSQEIPGILNKVGAVDVPVLLQIIGKFSSRILISRLAVYGHGAVRIGVS